MNLTINYEQWTNLIHSLQGLQAVVESMEDEIKESANTDSIDEGMISQQIDEARSRLNEIERIAQILGPPPV